MLPGYLYCGNGNLYNRGTNGNFWSSTPVSYTGSRSLYFYSTYVSPKNYDYKPHGLTLRCVARFFRTSTYAQKNYYAPPSRALRSLPLSVMMSGLLAWNSGSRHDSGIYGYSWSSTPIISGTYKYISSRHLDFNSTNVYPTYGSYKPFGFTLRCVAFQSSPQPFSYSDSRCLAFLSTNVYPKHGYNKPRGFTLRCVAFQSSPQPPSFGYDVGILSLGKRQSQRQRHSWHNMVIHSSHLQRFIWPAYHFLRFWLYKRSHYTLRYVPPLRRSFSSRALRSLPLSVMMSGYYWWGSGSTDRKGEYGRFWTSTLDSYTNSRLLTFYSTNVGPKNTYNKAYGFTLRRVAQLFATFLPELSAAFLFRL